MDANDIRNMDNSNRIAKMLERVDNLARELETVGKSDLVSEMEIDVYPYQVIVDIELTNGHNIRVPFSVFGNPHSYRTMLTDMITMTGELEGRK